eukprot:scaffold57468_cov62-Phaeocystis_antarctica.AAC.9
MAASLGGKALCGRGCCMVLGAVDTNVSPWTLRPLEETTGQHRRAKAGVSENDCRSTLLSRYKRSPRTLLGDSRDWLA